MPNHPNRPQHGHSAMTGAQLFSLRSRCGLTQPRAAELARAALRTYQQWEAGDRQMPRAPSELLIVSCLMLKMVLYARWMDPLLSAELLALIRRDHATAESP